MGHGQAGSRQRIRLYRVGMVLGGDLHLPRLEIFDRVISAPVAEFQLVSGRAVGKGDDLMSKTDAENRQLASEGADKGNHRLCVLRVAGAVGDEQAIRVHGHHFLDGNRPRNDGHFTPPGVQTADDVVLDAAVNGHNAVLWICTGGYPRGFRTHHGNLIGGQSGGAHFRKAGDAGGLRVHNQRLAGTLVPDVAGKAAGVHTGDAHNVILDHHVFQCPRGAEIGRLAVEFPDDQTADGGSVRLIVFIAHAVITDQGVGHDHSLRGVGRVRENFLIAHHGGVEHQLHQRVPFGAEAVAVKLGAILQNDFSVKNPIHGFSPAFLWESFCSNWSFRVSSGIDVG